MFFFKLGGWHMFFQLVNNLLNNAVWRSACKLCNGSLLVNILGDKEINAYSRRRKSKRIFLGQFRKKKKKYTAFKTQCFPGSLCFFCVFLTKLFITLFLPSFTYGRSGPDSDIGFNSYDRPLIMENYRLEVEPGGGDVSPSSWPWGEGQIRKLRH